MIVDVFMAQPQQIIKELNSSGRVLLAQMEKTANPDSLVPPAPLVPLVLEEYVDCQCFHKRISPLSFSRLSNALTFDLIQNQVKIVN